METKDALPSHRLKVVKNINKNAVMLKLSFNFFFIYIGILLASLLLLLTVFSGKTLFIAIIVNIVSYMVIQYLDKSNFLEDLNFKKLPESINNNLYELRHETNPIIKNPPNSKRQG